MVPPCPLSIARLAHAVKPQGLGTIKHIHTVQHRSSQNSNSKGLASGTAAHVPSDEALYDSLDSDSSDGTDGAARQGNTYEDDYAYLLEDVHMAGKSGGFQSDDDSPLFRRQEASQQLMVVVVVGEQGEEEQQEGQSGSSSSSGLLGWAEEEEEEKAVGEDIGEEEDAVTYDDKQEEEYM